MSCREFILDLNAKIFLYSLILRLWILFLVIKSLEYFGLLLNPSGNMILLELSSLAPLEGSFCCQSCQRLNFNLTSTYGGEK